MANTMLAERNVIGCLLMDNKCITDVSKFLKPEMFESELHGMIYAEFLKGFDNGYDVNLATIQQRLGDHFPEDVFLDEISKCMEHTMSTAEIGASGKAIESAYKANRATSILSSTKFTPSDIKSQIGAIINELEALQDDSQYTSKTMSEIVAEFKDSYFKEDTTKKIHTGFRRLDSILGGLEGGDMIVIGARPAVGKSALVTQIANYMALDGKNVGFYNLEMKEKQVYERFVVNSSGISLNRLKRATQFFGDEKDRFDKANESLGALGNIRITTGSKSMADIKAECKNMGYDIIIIDYMQLLRADSTYRGNRYAEVGAISKAIKGLAMELNIPIICLSQLNRASEGREDREPSMAELRESGDMEQDASIIVLLWNLDQDHIRKGCKVAKNRQGITGKMTLKFAGDLMRFEETDESIGTKFEQSDECPFS